MSFFETIRLFLDHGVTHVAEAAFQHAAWARGLEPLYPLADFESCGATWTRQSRELGRNAADGSSPADPLLTTPLISRSIDLLIRLCSMYPPWMSTPRTPMRPT